MKPLLTTTALLLCAAPALAATDNAAMDRSVGNVCDQGYAEIDVNADGKLTRDEVAQGTKAAFPKLDADGDGTVGQEEFTACLNRSAGTTSMKSDRDAANMAEYDLDEDGTLSRVEFMSAGQDAMERATAGEADEVGMLRLMFVPTRPQSTPDYTGWSPDDFAASNAAMFHALDTDESGDLSAEEWARKQATRKDRSDAIRAEFKAADRDGSGDLTESELTEMRAGKAEKATESAAASDGHRHPPVVYYRYDSTM